MREPETGNRRSGVGACTFVILVLLGLTWIVFGQTLGHEFINFDDGAYVYDNPEIKRGLSFERVLWAFTHLDLYLWNPLTTISHMLDCQLFGLAPAGHHLTNVLLHAASVVLLFLVLARMTGALWRSAFVAAVFAVHPLRVESVAWVAERKDVLSGLFFTLTLAAYAWYARGNERSLLRYLAVAVFFALGLMAKPMLVTVPIILLLLDYWPLRRFEKPPPISVSRSPISHLPSPILEKLPLLALSACSCVVTLFGGARFSKTPAPFFPLPLRIGNALVSIVVYLKQMICPVGLAIPYPLSISTGPALWKVVFCAVVVLAISISVVLGRRRGYLLTGWLWYLVMLAPILGVLQMGSEAHADRYTYLPHIGISVLVTWAVADLSASWRFQRPVLGGVAALLLAAMTLCARQQASYWHDSESLWRHSLANTEQNPLANNNLAAALLKKRQVEEAIGYFERALEIAPGYPEAEYNLGNAFYRVGRERDAVIHFQKALDMNPSYVEAYNNLAHLLAAPNDPSIRDGARAVKLSLEASRLTEGKNPVVLNTLALAYAAAGRSTEATETRKRALELAVAQGNGPLAERIRNQIAHEEQKK